MFTDAKVDLEYTRGGMANRNRNANCSVGKGARRDEAGGTWLGELGRQDSRGLGRLNGQTWETLQESNRAPWVRESVSRRARRAAGTGARRNLR